MPCKVGTARTRTGGESGGNPRYGPLTSNERHLGDARGGELLHEIERFTRRELTTPRFVVGAVTP